MIRGIVNADSEAIIRLLVRGPTGQQQRIKAVIDTGYDGWLSLPPALITALRLPWLRRIRAELADGSMTILNIHEGTVIWNRRRRLIHVDEADTSPLVGMALLEGYELTVQVRKRGKVAIRALP
ncbi:MAG TPA: clan AA aspartic protease [Gemmataceae bacterium]|nr:clan AA aspartic protease [Gemmataceae bacterium]